MLAFALANKRNFVWRLHFVACVARLNWTIDEQRRPAALLHNAVVTNSRPRCSAVRLAHKTLLNAKRRVEGRERKQTNDVASSKKSAVQICVPHDIVAYASYEETRYAA